MSTPAPFLSRHLGDYLLVAQLSEDSLGTVFRALYAADERRFVRLRILQSEELVPEAILLTVHENRLRDTALANDAIVVRPELDLVDGIPFMTWDETAGWTLDTMLARVRAFGIRIPVEYALLIAERIAAALEHAHQTSVEGRAVEHGLLWPGFVSISHDAVVRVGGFGVADGILPSLGGPRMTAEIAPYVAPEVRRDGKITPQSDVYSLGAILIELMTGRRPSLDTPSAELRAGDPRSDELSGFLQRCLADPAQRFSSAVEAHRALQQMVTGNPFSLFTANLALFLYKLLNPESQSVAPSSDWESTSPVVTETTKTRRAETTATAAPREATRPAAAAGTSIPPKRSRSRPGPRPSRPRRTPTAPPDPAPAPLAVQEHAAELIESVRPPPSRRCSPAPASALPPWKRPALLFAAAAGVAAGVFLVAGRAGSALPKPWPVPRDGAAAASRRGPRCRATCRGARDISARFCPPEIVPAASRAASASRPARKIHPELKHPAEDLRYKAAIARIEADRLSARERAPEIFSEGARSEEEGVRLLRERDYDAARMAFSRAARLFEEARDRTWEERVRNASLSDNNP